MTDVSSASKHFPTAKEGFTTTTSGSVSSGATTVGLNSVSGFSNGETVVLVIEPTSSSAKQVFTGVVDTAGVQITNVIWTEGTNQAHAAGSTIVDYETATHWALYRKGIRVEHDEDGTHSDITATTLSLSSHLDVNDSSTAVRDSSDNELLKFAKTASAVNELTVGNAAASGAPYVQASGGDTNIDINLIGKGSGVLQWNSAQIGPQAFKNPYKFSAYRNAALTSSTSWTAVVHDTELFDTGSNFSTSTGRFTAPIAGFYYFTAGAGLTAATGAEFGSRLQVNGAAKITGNYSKPSVAPNIYTVSGLIQLAASDYVEHAFLGGSGSTMFTGAENCYFQGFLVSAT